MKQMVFEIEYSDEEGSSLRIMSPRISNEQGGC